MENEEIVQDNLTPAQRVKHDWKLLAEKLSYKAIVNNLPYMIFLAILCIIYISNSNRAIEMQRDLNEQNSKLSQMRWKYLDIKSQLMLIKTESQVMNSAKNIGLKTSLLPAYRIATDSTGN